MGVEHTPWPSGRPPTLSDIESAFRREGLRPAWWANNAGEVYGVHQHPYHKVLYCAEGSIAFRVAHDTSIELRPGDRLYLPAGTGHSALVGPSGVRCAEAFIRRCA